MSQPWRKFLPDEVREAAIAVGDVVASEPTDRLGRYQGNGRFGGLFGRFGLHDHPSEREEFPHYGVRPSQFMHMRHWGRFRFHSADMQAESRADYILPLARIHWETVFEGVSDYSQRQTFWDGRLATRFTLADGSRVGVETWFDPVERDLAVIEFEVTGEAPTALLSGASGFVPYSWGYNRRTVQSTRVSRQGEGWELEIRCEATTEPVVSRLYVSGDVGFEFAADGLRIRPRAGRSRLFVSYGRPVEAEGAMSAAQSRVRSAEHWRRTWRDSAGFVFPEETSQKLWVRSLAYLLSSFNDDALGFAPTNGLSGHAFPFNFAQDLFYAHPALLAAGHVGVVKKWIERFRALLPSMQAYARKLWPQVEGIYPPWELPFGPIEGYHEPSVPIIYCYEPHNSACLARMAHETGLMADDEAWTRENVVPLVREVARFYRSFCRKEADGLWHFSLQPCVGQDEAGGRNQRDYLCTLYAAKDSFQIAIAQGLDADGDYARILADGLAFAPLLSEQGFYYASAGSGARDFGKQKHPVQLNGLAYHPVASAPAEPERVAYALRYETTAQAKEPRFFGWTLGEFLVAGSHLGDAAGWRKDWGLLRRADYVDEAFVQIYESSGSRAQAFYVTTHGLFAQSLAANVVSDHWGRLEVMGCPVYEAPVHFARFRSLLGVEVSGVVGPAGGEITLTAWKDCSVVVNGAEIRLCRGQTRELTLSHAKRVASVL